MAKPRSFFNFVIVTTVLLAFGWKRCENLGHFHFKGIVYSVDGGSKKPLDSIRVTVLREYEAYHDYVTAKKTWMEGGTTWTNMKGQYEIHGTTEDATYYLVFENPSYITDTVNVQKKGKSVRRTYDHEMMKK